MVRRVWDLLWPFYPIQGRLRMNQIDQFKNQQITETMSLYRGLILDAVEVEMSDLRTWPTTRSRLLKLLGDRGLEGKLRDILGVPVNSYSERQR